MKNIVVLLSGQGSNLQALIDACARKRVKANIAAVFSNNPEAYGLVLAGYMRILSPEFVALFAHPSLLPKYPGLHTHRKALENADKGTWYFGPLRD